MGPAAAGGAAMSGTRLVAVGAVEVVGGGASMANGSLGAAAPTLELFGSVGKGAKGSAATAAFVLLPPSDAKGSWAAAAGA